MREVQRLYCSTEAGVDEETVCEFSSLGFAEGEESSKGELSEGSVSLDGFSR